MGVRVVAVFSSVLVGFFLDATVALMNSGVVSRDSETSRVLVA